MELDFSDEFLEKLLFKQALLGKKYLNIITKTSDQISIKDQNLKLMYKLLLKYFNKHNQIPSEPILINLIKKAIDRNPEMNLEIGNIQSILNELNTPQYNLSNEVLTSNLDYFIKKKTLLSVIDKNIENLESNADNVVETCLSRFEKVQNIIFNDSDLGMNYFDAQSVEEHWKFINNPEAKIKTGWYSIDQYTNGGFLKDGRSLYIFMGQAGLGKSVFLSNLGCNFLKQGLSVVVISLEMSQDVYATRFDAHISGKNINRLKDNQEEARARIQEFYNKHPESNLYIKEWPPRSIRTSDIELYLQNLKNAGHNFDVIIVDYLNLVLPQHNSDNMYQGALEVSEKLRALSYKFEVPVVTAVQANSEGMNNENIGMEHISESRGIAHTADFIVGLYQQPDDREQGIISCRILKNRLGGQVGKLCKMKLDPETLVLSDMTINNDDIEDADSILGIDQDDENFKSILNNNFQQLSAQITSVQNPDLDIL